MVERSWLTKLDLKKKRTTDNLVIIFKKSTLTSVRVLFCCLTKSSLLKFPGNRYLGEEELAKAVVSDRELQTRGYGKVTMRALSSVG